MKGVFSLEHHVPWNDEHLRKEETYFTMSWNLRNGWTCNWALIHVLLLCFFIYLLCITSNNTHSNTRWVPFFLLSVLAVVEARWLLFSDDVFSFYVVKGEIKEQQLMLRLQVKSRCYFFLKIIPHTYKSLYVSIYL